MTVSVDVGVACSNHQVSQWWAPVMSRLLQEMSAGNVYINNIFAVSSALPDHNKNNTINSGIASPEQKRRNSLTDANRVSVIKRFLDGKSDWLFFMDDDTVPPPGAISKLLAHGRQFIGGLYYNNNPPYNPIAYMRRSDGLYNPIYHFPYGAIMPVDAIGMGCTLIHRTVFETIMEDHFVYERPNGSLGVAHKSIIYDNDVLSDVSRPDVWISGGLLHMKVKSVDITSDDTRAYPFFSLEYGRTEDFHFCELADNVGIKPWVDTTINCEHWKAKPTTRDDYKEYKNDQSADVWDG